MPREQISTAEWSQKNFHLPVEVGTLPGLYNLYYAPYMWGIFAALDDPEIPEVVLMKAAQIGWTIALIAYLARRVVCDPCAIVMMFSGDEASREFMDEKFKPVVRSTPVLSRCIDVSASRRDGNRSAFKKFPGGFLKLGGSRSIHKLKSTPAQLVIVEEPDDAHENVKGQGDSISLLWERTKRARNGKRILGGTPSIKGVSRVERHINQSDQRILPILCHSCGKDHVLSWEHVGWDESPEQTHPVYGAAVVESAYYRCPHCDIRWDDYQRKENIRNTVRVAIQAGDPYYGWKPTVEAHGVVGFMELNELYSCLPGAGVADLVKHFLAAEHQAARGDLVEKIVFINSKMGRPYEYLGDETTADVLKSWALGYSELVVPVGGLLLTVGVDVQQNPARLAVVVRAWGRGEESWLVYWGELYASKSLVDIADPVWDGLDQLLFGGFRHAIGVVMYPEAISIDSGDGNTNDVVYEWVRSRARAHRGSVVMAIKGSSDQSDVEIFTTPPSKSIDHHNPRQQTKADKYGLKIYQVGTHRGKDWLAAHQALEGTGPGRWHVYEGVRDDYWDQITAEVKAPSKKHSGRKVWQRKSGRANEALDCEVYALHAARAVKVHLASPARWNALEMRLRQGNLFVVSEVETVPVAPVVAPQVVPQALRTPPPSQFLMDVARRYQIGGGGYGHE